MAHINIVTDSSAQLTAQEIKDNHIFIVPLSVELDGINHVDGETITRPELVEALRKGIIPKTSQPPMGRFIDVFEKAGADGSEVLAIMMSDVLSGTYQTACAAAEMVDASVTVINSKETDRALSFQVLAAVEDAAKGKSIAEIKEHLWDIHLRSTTDVLVDNLDCLVAGGRVSKMAGLLTKMINLKVVVRLRENSLDVVYKGRSRKAFVKYCQSLEKYHTDNPIEELSLSNVGTDPEFIERIKDRMLPEGSKDARYISELTSPIIMTHTGLNAIGVITLTKKPEPEENR
ncbi:EDD domain protein, DegV family [Ligilactobacillus sp. WC1T17]|uniref:EDD domain protein, DegV family n=1 Tax=Ligilactobacillus ruminis TaxID=1623 RepID=A0ABY1A8T2_9LACO|nr:EDD domain protein, DegV family [Ligilactobacillus ruminis]